MGVAVSTAQLRTLEPSQMRDGVMWVPGIWPQVLTLIQQMLSHTRRLTSFKTELLMEIISSLAPRLLSFLINGKITCTKNCLKQIYDLLGVNILFIHLFCKPTYLSDTGSCYEDWAGFELMIFLPLPPEWELQMHPLASSISNWHVYTGLHFPVLGIF